MYDDIGWLMDGCRNGVGVEAEGLLGKDVDQAF